MMNDTNIDTDTSGLTPLQWRVVRDVLSYVRRQNLRAGERLVESSLAARIGTSRSPVNVALRHLQSIGVLSHDLNRGFSLCRDACELNDLAGQLAAVPDDPLYLRIAEDRLAQRLPDVVSEADLMRLYGVSRSALRAVLARIEKEDWIEKSVGHGWVFQPMIDSKAAYEESYVFRIAIEPVAMRSEHFRIDAAEFASLVRQQRFIAEGGFETMAATELYEANSLFHETIAKWSGNRFIVQGLRRADRLRRLVEYRQAALGRGGRREQALEHLIIMDAIASGNQPHAAELMRTHLEGALRRKAMQTDLFSGSAVAETGADEK